MVRAESARGRRHAARENEAELRDVRYELRADRLRATGHTR